MFRLTCYWGAKAAHKVRSARWTRGSKQRARTAALQAQLMSLRSTNQSAGETLRERRRLLSHRRKRAQDGQQAEAAGESPSSKPRYSSEEEATEIPLLPENEALETAVALTLYSNRDARAELEFTRRLVNSTLLSLASPVGPWDPYDVKPQVFALDNYLALPVFTSIGYLRLFCDRFGFTVRDPSGVSWAAGEEERYEARALQLTEGVLDRGATAWGSLDEETTAATPSSSPASPGDTAATAGPVEEVDLLSPEALFEDMEGLEDPTETPPDKAKKTKKKKKKKKKRLSLSRRSKKRRTLARKKKLKGKKVSATAAEETDSNSREAQERQAKVREHFRQRIAEARPFHLSRATPLPMFGPFTRPFLVGYFADVGTLLHNASIVPEKVDIILNPTSLIELVLAREATDRVLQKDKLLLKAYQKVEKTLQREFGGFLERHCPEVRWAKSACIPRPLDLEVADHALRQGGYSRKEQSNPLQSHRERTGVLRELEYSGGVVYDLVIILNSEDYPQTYQTLQWGKHRALLLGHRDLEILPEETAAKHVTEAATLFYDGAAAQRRRKNSYGGDGESEKSVFVQLGETQTVSATQSADSYYHDPSNAYTEAHSVYTEELKLKRRQ